MGESSALDPQDGLPVHEGGQEWSREKLALIENYTHICQAVRAKFLRPQWGGGANYIDLYCSYGRVRMKAGGEVIDGSALTAVKAAIQDGSPFSGVYVADMDEERAKVCAARISALGSSVEQFAGPSKDTVEQVLARLNPSSLNFCVLDPFGLQLPLSLIKRLITVKRMDIMVLVSAMELQRNLGLYLTDKDDTLDQFAPGWRDCFTQGESESAIRQKIMQHWRGLLTDLGLQVANRWPLITGTKRQPLYWFGLFGTHPLAAKFFDKIVGKASPQTGFDF